MGAVVANEKKKNKQKLISTVWMVSACVGV